MLAPAKRQTLQSLKIKASRSAALSEPGIPVTDRLQSGTTPQTAEENLLRWTAEDFVAAEETRNDLTASDIDKLQALIHQTRRQFHIFKSLWTSCTIYKVGVGSVDAVAAIQAEKLVRLLDTALSDLHEGIYSMGGEAVCAEIESRLSPATPDAKL